MKKGLLSLFAFGLLFGAAGIVNNNQPIEVDAAIGTTAQNTIKVDLISAWTWYNWRLFYTDVQTVSGFTYNAGEVDFSAKTFTFPWYVTRVDLQIKGNDGSTSGPYVATTILQDVVHGDYDLDLSWVDPNRVLSSVRIGDYTTNTYNTTEGYTGGIDSSRVRLWVDRGDNYGYPGYAVLNVDDVLIKPSGYVNKHDGYYYAYYDVVLSSILGKEIKFHKLSDDYATLWNTSATVTYASGDNSALFVIGNGSTNTLVKGQSVTGSVFNSFVAKVLEGYLTCSSSEDNGHGAFDALDTFLIPGDGLDDLVLVGALADAPDIIDYAGVGETGYADPRGTGVAVDPLQKYLALQDMASNGDWTRGIILNEPVQEQSLESILIIGILSITALAGFLLITKKK